MQSVSVRKGIFSAHAASIFGLACATYASAQSLDFLAWTKNPSFPNRKLLVSHPVILDGNQLKFTVEKAVRLWYPLPP
jgi:hypothetical protein